ncbi:MAG: hypothetical protein M3Y08_17275 [Fibrobacterota bacterium]|nr:hypothetical protein [Fibrobacterota bacterium]
MGKSALDFIRTAASVLFIVAAPWAQVGWQTTHTTLPANGLNVGECGLVASSMRVKVFPAYLEVEEDAEIAALGGVTAGNDPKTLEISGTFLMPPGTAITGALLWEGDKVLQGKLLDRNIADSLYESLVDRDSIPPTRPRDPIIIERVAKDTYRFRIYPVETGRTRRFRLRYQLPPVITDEGLEIPMRAAIAPLFPGSGTKVSVTFQGGGEVTKAILAVGMGAKTEMTFPRTRLLNPMDLIPQAGWDPYTGQWSASSGMRILPYDPLRQVVVKTSFSSGQMAGHYLNLYAGVTEDVLKGLNRRVEVVVLWKWHNPGSWIIKTQWGEEFTGYVWEAMNQQNLIQTLYQSMGGLGTRIGLVHDDSKNEPHAFKASNRSEPEYAAAIDYLTSIQGGYPEQFVRGIKAGKASGSVVAGVTASKNRFRSNLRLVKTLYSQESGTVRHLLVVSAGPEFIVDKNDMNVSFDSLFSDKISISGYGGGFQQAGFDFFEAKKKHAYKGPVAASWMGDVPGFADMNLNVIVRNATKAYDFSIACQGGISPACGSLTFHGKSDLAWRDSLEWEAFDRDGRLMGTAKTLPVLIGKPEDTAIAVLWAGSGSAFSEKKELPLGPVFGFVDEWASLLATAKDSLKPDTYSDSGVPRISNESLKDVIPNYTSDYVPSTVISAKQAGPLAEPSTWRIERVRGGGLNIRIPGLVRGVAAEMDLFGPSGKRAGYWSARSEHGVFNLPAVAVRPGVYLLQIRVAGSISAKRIVL